MICGLTRASLQNIEAEEQKGLFYPNPTNGQVNLNTSMALESIQVFNLLGKMIKEITNFNNPTINLKECIGLKHPQKVRCLSKN